MCFVQCLLNGLSDVIKNECIIHSYFIFHKVSAQTRSTTISYEIRNNRELLICIQADGAQKDLRIKKRNICCAWKDFQLGLNHPIDLILND
jgi:hypothetical protein